MAAGGRAGGLVEGVGRAGGQSTEPDGRAGEEGRRSGQQAGEQRRHLDGRKGVTRQASGRRHNFSFLLDKRAHTLCSGWSSLFFEQVQSSKCACFARVDVMFLDHYSWIAHQLHNGTTS